MIATKRSTPADDDFKSLVVLLDKELWARYPNTQQNYAPHNKLQESMRVILAYDNNFAVGCGCFRPTAEAGTVEIKRMYVRNESRGKGIAKQILHELESWAREEGYRESKLETAVGQPEAIAVYKRAGYKEIPNYPPYVNMPESICMAKSISNI